METMLTNLRSLVNQVNDSSNVINKITGQILDANQSLSSGTNSQAAALEEISASNTQITQQAVSNAEKARDASKLANTTTQTAQSGQEDIESLLVSMADISSVSKNIDSILRMMDDIAFQTNLLALNAAVEAARAGAAGKGFAVVANEVRNLATRSAKAAQESQVLIDEQSQKVQGGLKWSHKLAESFKEIVSNIIEVNTSLEQIAGNSTEQEQGIKEINRGLTQIEDITQKTTEEASNTEQISREMSQEVRKLQTQLAAFTRNGQACSLNAPVVGYLQ